MVRATVLTYRWIDDLQEAAYQTLGAIAGRAIGYLAPGVALGGAIVSAGLIETDPLDRDGVAGYLNELAETNPELMDHLSNGGGGLVEAMQMRSILTSGVLAGGGGRTDAAGGLRAIGVAPFPRLPTAAVRDVAGPVVAPAAETPAAPPPAAAEGTTRPPRTLEDLMSTLSQAGRDHRPPGRPRPLHRVPARTRRRRPRARAAGCGSSAATTRRTPREWWPGSRRPSRAPSGVAR